MVEGVRIMEKYDVVVIGNGVGGHIALNSAEDGQRTALVDKPPVAAPVRTSVVNRQNSLSIPQMDSNARKRYQKTVSTFRWKI